jgi:hypothetical protein
VHGYTTAFAFAAAIFGLGAVVAGVLFEREVPAVEAGTQPVLAH